MATYLQPKVVQRIAKEIMNLHKEKIEGIDISDEEDLDNVSELHATIHGPQGTPYEGGQFQIKLTFCEEFPAKPPKGYFVTKIFHPNVSREGDICVNTLKRDWKSTNTLRHVLLVVRCLMIEPNPDSALNADAGRLIQDNYEAFSNKARMMTDIYAKKKKDTTDAPTIAPSEDESKENDINTNNVAPAVANVDKLAKPTSSATVKKPTTATAKDVKKKNLKRL